MNYRALALLISVVIVTAGVASPDAAANAARIDRDVSAAVRYNIPGATVAVVAGGKVVYARAFGFRDIRTRALAGLDTHYEIGSITKQFTAAAIVQMS